MKVFIQSSEALASSTNANTDQSATAAGLSELQKQYRAFMKARCEEAGKAHPFDGTPDEISDFMLSISEGWAEYKSVNGLA